MRAYDNQSIVCACCFLQVTLENYYSNLIAQHIERKQRLAKLEESLKDDSLSEQQKQEKRLAHAQKETEFLRLKRSRLGVEDFEPLKVIGRGAFGEVRRRIDSGSRARRRPMSERAGRVARRKRFPSWTRCFGFVPRGFVVSQRRDPTRSVVSSSRWALNRVV